MKLASVLILVVASIGVAGERPAITVKELPPETIPVGPCKESMSGLLSISKGGKVAKDRNFSAREIGDYVNIRLSQGYSVSLYPQPNGKIFAIATCEALKH